MLLRPQILDQVRAGKVSLAFRRWMRPTVRPGASLPNGVGRPAIEAVDRVGVRRLETLGPTEGRATRERPSPRGLAVAATLVDGGGPER